MLLALIIAYWVIWGTIIPLLYPSLAAAWIPWVFIPACWFYVVRDRSQDPFYRLRRTRIGHVQGNQIVKVVGRLRAPERLGGRWRVVDDTGEIELELSDLGPRDTRRLKTIRQGKKVAAMGLAIYETDFSATTGYREMGKQRLVLRPMPCYERVGLTTKRSIRRPIVVAPGWLMYIFDRHFARDAWSFKNLMAEAMRGEETTDAGGMEEKKPSGATPQKG